MTKTAKVTAILFLVSLTPLAHGQQAGPAWATVPAPALVPPPSAAPQPLQAPPTITYRAAAPSTLPLPPPPPATSAPVPATSVQVLSAPVAPAPLAPIQVAPIQVPPVVTYRPLVPVTPMPAQYYVGQGLLGQPKLYVPAQPVRNFLRYLSP
jgi:hypothetical protein